VVEERLIEEALVVVEPFGSVGDGLLPHLARLLAQAHPTFRFLSAWVVNSGSPQNGLAYENLTALGHGSWVLPSSATRGVTACASSCLKEVK
jgi:hypothetical protein